MCGGRDAAQAGSASQAACPLPWQPGELPRLPGSPVMCGGLLQWATVDLKWAHHCIASSAFPREAGNRLWN